MGGSVVALDVTVVSSRRSYEFKFDDLRLTVLSTPSNREALRALLRCDSVAVTQPPPTLFPVTATIPPGLVFSSGEWMIDSGEQFPIRYVHIEPTRIVIDVAGPSEVIDQVFEAIVRWAATLHLHDGHRAVAEPYAAHDQSEISTLIGIRASDLLQPWVAKALTVARPAESKRVHYDIAPTYMVRFVPREAEFQPGPAPPEFVLEHRSSTRLDEGRLFSIASLDSGRHVRLLETIWEAAAGRQSTPERAPMARRSGHSG